MDPYSFLDFLDKMDRGTLTVGKVRDLAARIGLPTKMLIYVQTSFHVISSSHAWPFGNSNATAVDPTFWMKPGNVIHLTPHSLKSLINSNGQLGSVGAIYHEAVHAWLKHGKTPQLTKAKKFYEEEGRLTNGSNVENGKRVAHEAASEYVAARVEAYVNAANLLASFLRTIRKTTKSSFLRKVEEELEKTKQTYNKQMKEFIFGYDEVSDKKIWVTTKMPSYYVSFCDNDLLEGRIPTSVHGVGTLYQDVRKELKKKKGELQQRK